MKMQHPGTVSAEPRVIDLGAPPTAEDVRAREVRELTERLERLESFVGAPSPRGCAPSSRNGTLAKRLTHLEDDIGFAVSPERVAAGIRALAPFAPDRIVKLDALLAHLLKDARGPRASLDRMGRSIRTLATWGLVGLVTRTDGAEETGSSFFLPELSVHVVGVQAVKRELSAERCGEHVVLRL